MVDVGEHHVGQLDLEQVDLLAQHEGEQQVEGALEDLQVEVERGDGHRAQPRGAPGGQVSECGSVSSQAEKGAAFRALHEGEPFVIPNPWDLGSAEMFASLGFPRWPPPARAWRSRWAGATAR